jgi:hypothetical protein
MAAVTPPLSAALRVSERAVIRHDVCSYRNDDRGLPTRMTEMRERLGNPDPVGVESWVYYAVNFA